MVDDDPQPMASAEAPSAETTSAEAPSAEAPSAEAPSAEAPSAEAPSALEAGGEALDVTDAGEADPAPLRCNQDAFLHELDQRASVRATRKIYGLAML